MLQPPRTQVITALLPTPTQGKLMMWQRQNHEEYFHTLERKNPRTWKLWEQYI
jgi:hypothetical protein